MTKQLINKTAKKLSWRKKDTESAIKELLDSDSAIYSSEVLIICLNTDSPNDRWIKIVNYLLKTYTSNHIDLISKLIYGDPCFKLIAFFNVYDFVVSSSDERQQGFLKIENTEWEDITSLCYERGYKSFIHWGLGYLITHEHIVLKKDISTDPELLTYKFLDILLRKSTNLENDLLKPNSAIIEIIKNVGLLAFNLESIRNHINTITLYPTFVEHRESLNNLDSVINVSYKSHTKITDRKYWLWYAVTEELQKHGMGVRPSFREAGKLLDELDNSISRRYYEKKKQLTNLDMTLEDIIAKFHLRYELDSYLIKAEIIQLHSLSIL